VLTGFERAEVLVSEANERTEEERSGPSEGA